YVRDRVVRRSDPGVSELGRRSIRANNGRWPFMPATNHGGNRRARIAAISAFDNGKGGRAPAIRDEVSSALQDYVIGILRKVTRVSAMGHSGHSAASGVKANLPTRIAFVDAILIRPAVAFS